MRRWLPSATSPSWVLAETGVSAVFSLLSLLAVSRNIGPSAAGVGAVAIAAFLLLDLFGASMMTDAVIQWRRLEPRHARSAMTVTVLTGIGTAIVLVFTGFVLSVTTRHPQISTLTMALAPLLPLSAYSGVAAGLVLRQHRYRLLAMRVFIGQPIGLALGLLLAREHGGAWAMVALQGGNTLIVFLLLLLARAAPVRPSLDRAALGDLWPVAGPQLLSVVMLAGRYRLFVLALGMITTDSVVAVCNVGFRLLDAVLAVVSGSTLRITLPRLSALQDDPRAFAEAYGETAQFQALLGWPIATGVALTATNLVTGLMGPQWTSASQGTRIVACTALLAYSYGDASSLWIAINKTRMNLLTATAALLVPIIGLLLLRPQNPAQAALCWGATALVIAPINLVLVTRQIRRSPFWLMRRLWPAAAGTGAMALAVLAIDPFLPKPPLLALVCQAVVGAAVFGLVAFLALGRRLPRALKTHAPAGEMFVPVDEVAETASAI
jgi:O-antigen/teichoic acid export membrane protein